MAILQLLLCFPKRSLPGEDCVCREVARRMEDNLPRLSTIRRATSRYTQFHGLTSIKILKGYSSHEANAMQRVSNRPVMINNEDTS